MQFLLPTSHNLYGERNVNNIETWIWSRENWCRPLISRTILAHCSAVVNANCNSRRFSRFVFSLSPAYKILLFKFFNNSGDQIQKVKICNNTHANFKRQQNQFADRIAYVVGCSVWLKWSYEFQHTADNKSLIGSSITTCSWTQQKKKIIIKRSVNCTELSCRAPYSRDTRNNM